MPLQLVPGSAARRRLISAPLVLVAECIARRGNLRNRISAQGPSRSNALLNRAHRGLLAVEQPMKKSTAITLVLLSACGLAVEILIYHPQAVTTGWWVSLFSGGGRGSASEAGEGVARGGFGATGAEAGRGGP